MKHRCSVLCLFVLVSFSWSQTTHPHSTKAKTSAEQELVALTRALATALAAGDCQGWAKYVSADFRFLEGGRRAGAGEYVFIPRTVPHAWARVSRKPGKIMNVYQPAGKMEDFFRQVGTYTKPQIHEALCFEELSRLFHYHGMDMVGPPLTEEWKVDKADE